MIYYIYKCITGPTLIRLYRTNQSLGRDYNKNNVEYFSSSIIDIFHGICLFCKWTSPALLAFCYYKGYINIDYLITFSKVISFFGTILLSAYLFRGVGRFTNDDYNRFIVEHSKLVVNSKYSSEHRLFLLKYDFGLDNWVAEFKAKQQPPVFKNEPFPATSNVFDYVKQLGLRVLSRICIDTFGLRLMYPGVFLQSLLKPSLIQGRAKLIESKGATRSLIHTFDGKNSIDTVFIDKRNTSLEGQTLIICCDGNAAFYEMGIFGLCADKGYSALGWNYPGFGASTGLPYPEDVTSSADAVMQYALSLGFKFENIILFSWSIGGFASSWLASHYPEVKGVILDACFDDIVHLAVPQMPKFASGLVEFAVKTRLNLNVLNQIKSYPGPIRFIRRSNDEIITTLNSEAASNRGNDLLIGLLKKRYPNIINDETITLIRLWLKDKSEAERSRLYDQYVSRNILEIESDIKLYIEEFNLEYPLNIGKDINNDKKNSMALYLASKYLLNFDTTHCVPLPLVYIKEPWSEFDIINKNSNSNVDFYSRRN